MKLTALIEKAEVTIEQMRRLAKTTALIAVVAVKHSGRLGGVRPEVQERLKSDLVLILAGFGVGEAEIHDAWHAESSRWDIYDFRQAILGDFVPFDRGERCPVSDKWDALKHRDADVVVSVDDLRSLIEDARRMSPKVEKILANYAEVLAGSSPDPELWESHEEWKVFS